MREALSKLARCKERLLGVRTQSTGAAVARPRGYLSAARASLSKREEPTGSSNAARIATRLLKRGKQRANSALSSAGGSHRCRAARHGRADTFWQQQQRTDLKATTSAGRICGHMESIQPAAADHPKVEGTALVAGATHQATGRLAFSGTGLSFWGGVDPVTGIVIDERHPLHGRVVTDTILAIPSGRGSCTASQIVLELVLNNTAPRAIVLKDRDAVVAVGALVAREFFGAIPPLILACTDFDALESFDGEIVSVASNDTPLPLPQLTDADRNALNGADGPAEQRAMRIVVETARIQGAASLVDVSAAHIDACTYVGPCVEINQCVGCTSLGDDAAVLALSSGEEPASPRHRAGVASMAWRSTRRVSTNVP